MAALGESVKDSVPVDTAFKAQYVSPYNIAVIYVGLGEKDLAFDWLKGCCRPAVPAPLSFDGKVESIRSDARYAELRHRIGLPE